MLPQSRKPRITLYRKTIMLLAHRLQLFVAIFSAVLVVPALSVLETASNPSTTQSAEDQIQNEVRATILEQLDFVLRNKKSPQGTLAKEGSVEFWSSGGLRHHVPVDHQLDYDSVSGLVESIEVVPLPGGESAVATYYTEGQGKLKGGQHNAHYLVRAMVVFVKEDGKWKKRAAHYSPIQGGNGTLKRGLSQ